MLRVFVTRKRKFKAMSLSCVTRSVGCTQRPIYPYSRTAPGVTTASQEVPERLQPTRRTAVWTLSTALVAGLGASQVVLAEETTDALSPPKQVFLEISVDREPVGKVVIEVFDDVTVGGKRFIDLAVGKEGVRYQATKFIRLADNYVVNSGVRSLSLTETRSSPIAGGDSLQELLQELNGQRHRHDAAGIVSLVVKSRDNRQAKKKLVAVKGRFEMIEEGKDMGPNGTGFVITTAAAPELDETNLVVGRVVSGLDVVGSLLKLPTVKNNEGSVFYKAAKQLGDPRADIAEVSFGKPFNRVIVSSGGLFQQQPSL